MLPVLKIPAGETGIGGALQRARPAAVFERLRHGLDVVPLPGDSRSDALAALIADVAALSTKLASRSPRGCSRAGQGSGEMAHFDNPYLTDSVVLKAE